jgi:hypothetical protein
LKYANPNVTFTKKNFNQEQIKSDDLEVNNVVADNKLPLSSKTESRFNLNIFFSIATSSLAGSKYSSNHYQVHGKGFIKRGGD